MAIVSCRGQVRQEECSATFSTVSGAHIFALERIHLYLRDQQGLKRRFCCQESSLEQRRIYPRKQHLCLRQAFWANTQLTCNLALSVGQDLYRQVPRPTNGRGTCPIVFLEAEAQFVLVAVFVDIGVDEVCGHILLLVVTGHIVGGD